jgi:hypothetical protein
VNRERGLEGVDESRAVRENIDIISSPR